MFEGSSVLILTDESNIAINCVIDTYTNACIVAKSDTVVPDIRKGTLVNCVIYSNCSGQISLEAQVDDIVYNHVRLSKVKVLKEIQKREEVRIDVEVPVQVKKMTIKGNIMDLDKPILMHTRNISACGVLLNAELDMPLDVEFHFCLKLSEDSAEIHVVAKIVRKEELKDNEGYNYGCSIVLAKTNDVNIIRKYIFRSQIDKRNKSRCKTDTIY